MLPERWDSTTEDLGNKTARLSFGYVFPALVLFLLRCRYSPMFGAYMWYHSVTFVSRAPSAQPDPPTRVRLGEPAT